MSTAIAVWWVIFTAAGIVSFGILLWLAARYRKTDPVQESYHRFCLGGMGSGMTQNVLRGWQLHGGTLVVYDNKCADPCCAEDRYNRATDNLLGISRPRKKTDPSKEGPVL